jgi:hypothetical protein
MSKKAGIKYQEARDERVGLNDARRIITHIRSARSETSGASWRWPFELFQNAHDPGGRNGNNRVNIEINFENNDCIFRHDGCFFDEKDLAALSSGGSNKEYDSNETSGRFGTGFLVTHVLSPKVTIKGLLKVDDKVERFNINLDRSGTDKDILENAVNAQKSIDEAIEIECVKDIWTAEFIYTLTDKTAYETGLKSLYKSIRYLYGTCEYLGNISIIEQNIYIEKWTPGEPMVFTKDNVVVKERVVERVQSNNIKEKYKIIRFESKDNTSVGTVIVLKSQGEEWEFIKPEKDSPRIYSRFPVLKSNFIMGIVAI